MLKTYDKKDEVPEALREAAIETKEGKFLVDDGTGSKTDQDVAKLTEALEKERTKAKEEERARLEVEKERNELLLLRAAREQGISESALQKIRDDELRARTPLLTEVAELRAENAKLKWTDKVQELALGAGIMRDRIKQAMKLLEGRTKLGEDGGIVVYGEDEKPTAETIEAFLKATFKNENPFLYEGTNAAGSGAQRSTTIVGPDGAQVNATQATRVAGAF